MRQQLFDHYEKLSFSYYDQNNSGQMMSKLVSDLFDIAEFAHHGPENLFISLIKIVGSFVFLFLINWRLAIPLLILVLIMLVFSMKQFLTRKLSCMYCAAMTGKEPGKQIFGQRIFGTFSYGLRF